MELRSTFRHFSDRFGNRLFRFADKVMDGSVNLRRAETRVFERVRDSLPFPSKICRLASGYMYEVAYNLTSFCKECNGNPCFCHSLNQDDSCECCYDIPCSCHPDSCDDESDYHEVDSF